MTAKKQSKEPETPRAPKCPPCLDDCERCDDRTPDNKCKCPRRDTSDGCKFYHKPAPKEPDRMTDWRKAEIRRYAERWDRGAFKEYSELVCVLLDEIDALEAKLAEKDERFKHIEAELRKKDAQIDDCPQAKYGCPLRGAPKEADRL